MKTRRTDRKASGRAVPPPPVQCDDSVSALNEWYVWRCIDALAAAEVTVPAEWARVATPDRVFPGRCYDRSFNFACGLTAKPGDAGRTPDDVWLVHGECGGRPHAWVELPGGVVFDGVTQRFYDHAKYYAAQSARPPYMYSQLAACVISCRMTPKPNGTILLADWHELLGLPSGDPANPTRVGFGDVIPLLKRNGLIPPPDPPTRRRGSKGATA